jgi:hypothetical protein
LIRDFDLRAAAQIFFTLVIAVVIGWAFFGMVMIAERDHESQSEKIKEIIDRALIQCYALEGAYPNDIRYLSKYGVLFNNEEYEYYYELTWATYMPVVAVIPLD